LMFLFGFFFAQFCSLFFLFPSFLFIFSFFFHCHTSTC
jgi:hypothetical protein